MRSNGATPGRDASTDGQRSGSTSLLARVVGPCYTEEAIARVLDRSPEHVAALASSCCLLALPTADGDVVFPAFQVHDGAIVRGLSQVLSALRDGVDDPWAWALWLNSTPPVVEGIAPETSRIQQLIDGEFERVLVAAERSASSWRS